MTDLIKKASTLMANTNKEQVNQNMTPQNPAPADPGKSQDKPMTDGSATADADIKAMNDIAKAYNHTPYHKEGISQDADGAVLDSNYMLPNMKDYYFDVVNPYYYETINHDIGMGNSNTANDIIATKFYLETPPVVGYNEQYAVFCLPVNLPKNASLDGNYIKDIEVQDGDTISISTKYIGTPDKQCEEFIAQATKQIEKAYENIMPLEVYKKYAHTKLTLRFACIDCQEIPHFSCLGSSDLLKYLKHDTIDITDADRTPSIWDGTVRQMVSRYKSFLDYDGAPKITGNTYNQANTGKITILSQPNDSKTNSVEYFIKNDKIYYCVTDDSSADPAKVADGGIARDVVVEAISKADDMRILINGAAINRNPGTNGYTSPLRTDPYDTSILNTFKRTIESLTDNNVKLINTTFNLAGLGKYGRAIAAVYVHINGQWINLNKMVIAKTNQTLVNRTKHNDIGADEGTYSRAFNPDSYDLNEAYYRADLFNDASLLDDRNDIQRELFPNIDPAKFKDWTVTIGDVSFFVPPTAITNLAQTKTQRRALMRASGTMAKSSTKMNDILELELYFVDDKGINGYQYEQALPNEQKATYYMNGLRALIAEFKLAPFMPIENEYINHTLNISAVALQNLTVSTISFMPRVLKVTLQMTKYDYSIYMPEIPYDADDRFGTRNYFSKQIYYPLFRFYYQRLLQNGEALKDIPFLSKKYIESTFGNKTCLVPMEFKSSDIKFYIPNKEHLDKMKQIKIARMQRPAAPVNLDDKQKECCDNFKALGDALSNVGNVCDKLNGFLDGQKNCAIVISSNSTSTADITINEKVNNIYAENGFSLSPNAYKTKQVQNILANISNSFFHMASQAKAKNGENIVTRVSLYVLSDTHSDNNQTFFEIDCSINLGLNIDMSASEWDILKTYATEKKAPFDIDDIFKNNQMHIHIKIHGPYIQEDKIVGAEIGVPNTTYASIDTDTPDFQALAFFANVAANKDSVNGTEEANKLKEASDIATPDSIKFEPYDVGGASTILSGQVTFNMYNTFSEVTLQTTDSFAPQYLGGTDTTIQIQMTTTNKDTVAALKLLPQLTIEYAREYRLVMPCWPLKIESEITKLLGITDVAVEHVQISTKEYFPDYYIIDIALTSVDRTLRNREAMTKTDMKNFTHLTVEGETKERIWMYKQIDEMLSKAELYPDLQIPTIAEFEKAGFRFIRYSNPNRIYPDPDFYFTYGHLLTSDIVRESILNMLTEDEPEINVYDTYGAQMVGKMIKPLQEQDKNNLNNPEFAPFFQDLYTTLGTASKGNSHIRQICDFYYRAGSHFCQTWDIAPHLKVALCEKDMTNLISDYLKQEDKKDYKVADDILNPEQQKDVPLNNNIAKSWLSTAYFFINNIEKIFSKSAEDTSIDEALFPVIMMDEYHTNTYTTTDEEFKSVNEPVDQYDYSGRLYALTADKIKPFLEAAADAMSNNGGTYAQGSNQASWQSCSNYTGIYILDGQKPVAFTAASNHDLSDDEKDKVENLVTHGVQFSKYRLKMYTVPELQHLLDDNSILTNGEKGDNGRFPLDFYYWDKDQETIQNYRKKCLYDENFAQIAFMRNCLVWLFQILTYSILPSFGFDILRGNMSSEENIQKVLDAAAEANAKEQKDILQKSTQKALKNIDERQKELSAAGNKTDAQKKADTASADKQATNSKKILEQRAQKVTEEINKQLEQDKKANKNAAIQYVSFFKNNCDAVDKGKIFLTIFLGICEGDPQFINLLKNRQYQKLQAMSNAAFAQGSVSSAKAISKTQLLLNRFLRALIGRKIIDGETPDSCNDDFYTLIRKNLGRNNQLAASNDPKKYLLHSFYDMLTMDCRGRMLRAFPTFYFTIIDEGRTIGRWKLHDNFYNTNAIGLITVTRSKNIPSDTAEVVISNFFQTFTTDDEDLDYNYTVNYYDVLRSIWRPSQEEYAKEQDTKRTNAQNAQRMHLRPGARINIRMGYGGDASSLPTVFNGYIAEIQPADGEVTLIAQGDGIELAKPILMDIKAHNIPNMDENIWASTDSNSNGEAPTTILESILTTHGGWLNTKMHNNGLDALADSFGTSQNPFGIYHFGNRDYTYITGEPEPIQNIFAIDGIRSLHRRNLKVSLDNSIDEPIIDFDVFGKSVWDVMHICKSVAPNYITSIDNFGYRSTLFFGRTHDYYAYGYVSIDGHWYEKRKPYQQYHIYTSHSDIIGNDVRPTNKYIATCAVGLYDVQGTFNSSSHEKTDPIWVDNQIFPENQKTMYYDTKLYGAASKNAGGLSSAFNFLFATLCNDWADRMCDANGKIASHHAVATLMTKSALKDSIAKMYQGPLIVIGDPTVKPYDRIYVNDVLQSIKGQCQVRDVVHTLSPTQGFTTTIYPELIATTSDMAEEEIRKSGFFANAALYAVGGGIATLGYMGASRASSFLLSKLGISFDMASKAGKISQSVLDFIKSAKNLGSMTKAAQGALEAAGAASEVSEAAAAGAAVVSWPALAALAIGAGIAIVTTGTMVDKLATTISNAQAITLFPMMHYGKIFVAGINGHSGSCYGSPTFNNQGLIRKIAAMFAHRYPNACKHFVDIFGDTGVVREMMLADKSRFDGIKESIQPMVVFNTLNAVSGSAINLNMSQRSNLIMPRCSLTDQASKIQHIVDKYAVKSNTPETIMNDVHMQDMRFVLGDLPLKPYMQLGFFRVANTQQYFNSQTSDKIHCIYLKNYPKGNQNVAVNALVSNNVYDIPLLNKDAMPILEDLIENTFNAMKGTEQTRDTAKWYKDNAASFIVLKSALKAGSDKNLEATGFSFIVGASDDKSYTALEKAIKAMNDRYKLLHLQNPRIQEKIFEYKKDDSTKDISFVVLPFDM